MVHREDEGKMRAMAMRVKGIVALLSAIVADVAIFFEDDVMTQHEWFLVVMVTLGAVGAYLFPNTVNGLNVNDIAKRYEIMKQPPQ